MSRLSRRTSFSFDRRTVGNRLVPLTEELWLKCKDGRNIVEYLPTHIGNLITSRKWKLFLQALGGIYNCKFTKPEGGWNAESVLRRLNNLSLGEDGLVWADLLREVLGNPFKPIEIVYEEWRTPQVVRYANRLYIDNKLDGLLALSDMIEEEGCSDKEILDHLRLDKKHVRGCWALDVVLGRS
jgi:hypothetical protein